MPAPGRYATGRAMADVRRAIIRKIRAMKKRYPKQDRYTDLIELEQWISEMDERAKEHKGGVVAPRRPLKKLRAK